MLFLLSKQPKNPQWAQVKLIVAQFNLLGTDWGARLRLLAKKQGWPVPQALRILLISYQAFHMLCLSS